MLERRRRRPTGLPARVGIILLLVCLATMASGCIAMYSALSMDDDEMLDARLVALSAVILDTTGRTVRSGAVQAEPLNFGDSFGSIYRFQLWSPEGRLLLRSLNAPDEVPYGPLSESGLRDVVHGNERLRLLTTASADGGLVLQLAESLNERALDVMLASKRFLMLVSGPLCLIGWLAYRQTRQALAGLSRLASQVQQRGQRDLSPIETRHLPSELAVMMGAINDVFQRVDSGVRAGQAFSSMVAHELRSPLAGVRAQAQMALSSGDAEVVQAALKTIIGATDQSARIVDQLLDLGQFEMLSLPDARAELDPVDLVDVVYEALLEVERLRSSCNVAITTRLEELRVIGHRGGLFAVVRNLLHNAVRFTPSGGQVMVTVASRPGDGHASLVVEDSGPGIPPEQRDAALERFNRLGRNDAQGAGLGLAIVECVARLHRAALLLGDSPWGGLRVELRLKALVPDAGQAEAKLASPR